MGTVECLKYASFLTIFATCFIVPVPSQTLPASASFTTKCVGPGAILFALDGSESINATNFIILKEFVKANIQQFEIGKDFIQVAAFVWSQEIGDMFNFDPNDNLFSLFAKINSLRLIRLATFTDIAIGNMTEMLIQPNVPSPKVGVILTDGESYDKDKTRAAAATARNLGLTLIAVGIGVKRGSAADTELNDITGNPSQVLLLKGYDELLNLTGITALSNLLCRAITTSAPTTTQTTTTLPPTTTRPSTSQPFTTLDPSNLSTGRITNALCQGCVISEGVGYNRHGSDCQKFIQCYFEDNNAVAKENKCGFGQFFSLSHLACVHSIDSDCPTDPCIGQNNGNSYNMADNCQGYWTCMNGRSMPTCCGNQTRYNPGVGCVADLTCIEACPPTTSTLPFVCMTQADNTDAGYYLENVAGVLIRRKCAPGTQYDPGSCGCNIMVSVTSPQTCTPMLYHSTVDTNFYDAYNKIPVGISNVAVNIGSLVFSGNGEINIWRLANQDFQNTIVIRFELNVGLSATPRTEQILINCLHSNGPMQPASIDIQVVKTPAVTQLSHTLRTSGGALTLFTAIPPGVSTEVVFAYDGSHFAAYSGVGTEQSVALNGTVERRQTGFLLGRPSNTAGSINFLTGTISKFEVYNCVSDYVKNLLTAI